MQNKELHDDYEEFLSATGANIPSGVAEFVMETVDDDLNPSFWIVLAKLAALQTVAGFLSLLYCPQFGFSLSGSHGLMHYLMQYGETVCMVGCGALFTGFSLVIASLALRPEEVQVIRRNRVLQITAVVALSLGAFFCLGTEIFSGITLVWALGGIFGGLSLLELGWSIRCAYYRVRA